MKKQKVKAPIASESSATPTPGPWRTGEGSQWGAHNAIYCSPEQENNPGRRLAIFYTPGTPSDSITPEDRANARLAAAAPELLAVCERVLVDLGVYDDGLVTKIAHTTVDRIRAAIAKAKGLG
jgi:hypothetical protein